MRLAIPAFLAALTTTVLGHARIVNITTSSGNVYQGWDPETALTSTLLPPLVAWSASNLGNIFVPPSRFNTSDIACHYNATPGALHINTTAGDTLKMQWNEWPVSHKGPVLAYLAACNGSCADADKTALEWVKIDHLGWLNSSGWQDLGGTWASDVLIANHASWIVKIPESLRKGNYVLRHEIIALHVAEQADGAQTYPQCVNLSVQGGEEDGIEDGTIGSKLYTMEDKGMLVDIHGNITKYEIPGPDLWEFVTPFSQPNLKK